MRYSLLSFNQVHPGEQAVAELLAKIAARDLGIKPPQVFFFMPDSAGTIETKNKVLGYAPTSGGYICVRCGLLPARLYEVVLHEVRHYWQYQNSSWRNEKRTVWIERDAEIFSRQWPMIGQDWSYRQLELWLLRSVVSEYNAKIRRDFKFSQSLMGSGIEIR
jgi:hypothetical protein